MLLVIRLLDDIAELLLYHEALPILPLLSWNVVPGDLEGILMSHLLVNFRPSGC